jgi:hypothetical protein
MVVDGGSLWLMVADLMVAHNGGWWMVVDGGSQWWMVDDG